jgi:hypothetical protein
MQAVRTCASREVPRDAIAPRRWQERLATASRTPVFLSYKSEISVADMAIFHLSIRPISRAKGQSAVAQVAYDTRGKLTNKRTDEKHDWSKHKNDLIEWQIIGPPCRLAYLLPAQNRPGSVGMHEWAERWMWPFCLS